MPEGIILVGFADDVAIVGRAMNTEKLEEAVNQAIQIAHEWMNDRKLKLALHKTKAVMLTKIRDYRKPTFRIRGHLITTKNSIKYLELDKGRRFKAYEEAVGAKASKTAQALSRILPNVGGS